MPRSMAGYLCSHYRRYSKTPPLCFAQQNIGEVSEGRRGKKNIDSDSNKIKYHPLPLPVP